MIRTLSVRKSDNTLIKAWQVGQTASYFSMNCWNLVWHAGVQGDPFEMSPYDALCSLLWCDRHVFLSRGSAAMWPRGWPVCKPSIHPTRTSFPLIFKQTAQRYVHYFLYTTVYFSNISNDHSVLLHCLSSSASSSLKNFSLDYTDFISKHVAFIPTDWTSLDNVALWVMTPCDLVGGYQRFRGIYCVSYQTTRCDNPEDHSMSLVCP
jgi:hypothetical protein